MKSLEKGRDKVEALCKLLTHEAIEPAKKEAERILQEAKKEAELLIAKAHTEAEQILSSARTLNERESTIFHASLSAASKQVLTLLRQKIEKELFHPELDRLIAEMATDTKTVARLTNAIVDAITRDGINTDLSVVIPSFISPKAINALLLKGVANRLSSGAISIGNLKGGVQVKMVDKNIVIDLSDRSLKELLTGFIGSSFHEAIYGKSDG